LRGERETSIVGEIITQIVRGGEGRGDAGYVKKTPNLPALKGRTRAMG